MERVAAGILNVKVGSKQDVLQETKKRHWLILLCYLAIPRLCVVWRLPHGGRDDRPKGSERDGRTVKILILK